ncbi:MAG: hypothetical protein M3345_03835 [Actinomycetota bacterium]|nr:hypothetical protein [Actinomycetota bacterium]
MRHRLALGSRGAGVTLGALALLLWVVPAVPAAANHGDRTVDVTPESANYPLQGTAELTATLSAPATTASGTINIDFENEAGVNDTNGISRTAPDLTCSIPAGQTSCTVSYTGATAGRDVWRAWIDHDGLDSTVEADTAEGRNEANAPGDGGTNCRGGVGTNEPDCTDVVAVIWGTGTLDCDDAGGADTERNTNPAGGGAVSNETYTCTLTTPGGGAASGQVIQAEVENGINDPDPTDGASHETPDYTCTTGDGTGGTMAGVCTITVTQNENETGTASICFWSGTAAEGAALCANEPTDEAQAADGSDVGDDLADRVEKTWEVRSAGQGGIDAEPEGGKNPVGAQHTITVTVYDQFGAPFPGTTTVYFEFFRGSPSDTDGNTSGSPDRTCTTAGTSTCTFTYSSPTPGTDLVCVWKPPTEEAAPGPPPPPALNGNNNNGTCGGEGLADEDDNAGEFDPPQPRGDYIDVVRKIWQQPTSGTILDCSPERTKTRRNTTRNFVCLVTDAAGAPVAGAEVDAEAIGVNDPDASDSPTTPDFGCVTGADGRCTFGHGPSDLGGTDTQGISFYRVWIDADNDNSTVEADLTEGVDEATSPGATEPDDTDALENTWTAIRCDITGTNGNDRLQGTARDEVICGLGGNDVLLGGRGADRLLGDKGADRLEGNRGHDLLEGLRGDDTLYGQKGDDDLRGGPGDDDLFGGPGRDRCRGGTGRDTAQGCEY